MWLFSPRQLFSFLVAGLTLGFAIAAHAAEITVHAAASLTEVLTVIGHTFEAKHSHKVVFNFAASSLLARQVERGVPGDIFFSADEAKMDQLDKKGLLKPGSRKSILSNRLVVIIPKHSSSTLSSARGMLQFKRIALAEPSTVPAGIYAREYLEAEGVWSQIVPRVIPTENVRGAISAVAGKNVDAAIVYQSDTSISDEVKVAMEISTATAPTISYPIAILKRAKNKEAAQKFIEFLSGEEARRLFLQHQFILPK
ncbi:MAG: molybdate ABC transporter substrate-binding protein [Verrucomicrobiales bacterium]